MPLNLQHSEPPYRHPTSAMQQLKMATKAQHQTIESQLNLHKLGTSIIAYRHLLRRYYGFYQPIEQQLGALPWPAIDFVFAPRQKTTLLQQDLRSLGDSDDVISRLPFCNLLPTLQTLAQGFGCLYVLEGSTLGGQMIMRHLQKQLLITPTMGGTFFSSYGSELGTMWKSFGRTVDTFAAANPHMQPPMLATACATFEHLRHWLVENL